MKTEIKLIISILNDDHGISQETWDVMMDWMLTFSVELVDIVSRSVDVIDGRYYIKANQAQVVKSCIITRLHNHQYVRRALIQEL
jgi:hypothetical protein